MIRANSCECAVFKWKGCITQVSCLSSRKVISAKSFGVAGYFVNESIILVLKAYMFCFYYFFMHLCIACRGIKHSCL